MKWKSHIDNTADDLLKKYEEGNKLSKISSIASNLASALTGIPEQVILKKELEKQLPLVKNLLKERLAFFEAKKEWNGNITNLRREIAKCEDINKNIEKEVDSEEIKENIKWLNHIKYKYGF